MPQLAFAVFTCGDAVGADAAARVVSLDGIRVRNAKGADIIESGAFATTRNAPVAGNLYRWDKTSLAAPDGTSVVIPFGQDPLTPGRWLLVISGGDGAGLVEAADVEFNSTVPVIVAPIALLLAGGGPFTPVSASAGAVAIAAGPDNIGWTDLGSGRLRYDGASTRRFRIGGAVSFFNTGPAGSQSFSLAISMSGAPGNIASSGTVESADSAGAGTDPDGHMTAGPIIRRVDPGQIVQLAVSKVSAGAGSIGITALQLGTSGA